MFLGQQKYALDLLRKARMEDCKSYPTPSTLRKQEDEQVLYNNPEHYRSLVGSLQYLTITRPDIAHAVNRVCQHMHMPLEGHYNDI